MKVFNSFGEMFNAQSGLKSDMGVFNQGSLQAHVQNKEGRILASATYEPAEGIKIEGDGFNGTVVIPAKDFEYWFIWKFMDACNNPMAQAAGILNSPVVDKIIEKSSGKTYGELMEFDDSGDLQPLNFKLDLSGDVLNRDALVDFLNSGYYRCWEKFDDDIDDAFGKCVRKWK